MTVHPLTEARVKQEASTLDDHLGQVIHQAIVDLIQTTGSAHADDLEPYYPEGHRERCRQLQSGRFGSLRSRGYIVSREARTSKVKTRNFAKSGVYVFTAKGRATLVGIGGKGNEGPAPSDPGEDKAPVVHQQTTESGVASLQTPHQSPEVLSLFDQVAA